MSRAVRSRNFCFLFYPSEDKTHAMALRILESSDLQWCAIQHDRDVEDDGQTFKKAHVHGIIRFSSAQSIYGVASRLGVAPNYLQCCSDVVSAMQYLCHANDLDKYQYPDTCIYGSCVDQARTYVLTARNCSSVPRLSESEAFGNILEFVSSWEGYLRYSDVCAWAVTSGLFGYFRQSYSIVRDLVSEHNRSYERQLLIDLRSDNVHTDGFASYVAGCEDTKKELLKKGV